MRKNNIIQQIIIIKRIFTDLFKGTVIYITNMTNMLFFVCININLNAFAILRINATPL